MYTIEKLLFTPWIRLPVNEKRTRQKKNVIKCLFFSVFFKCCRNKLEHVWKYNEERTNQIKIIWKTKKNSTSISENQIWYIKLSVHGVHSEHIYFHRRMRNTCQFTLVYYIKFQCIARLSDFHWQRQFPIRPAGLMPMLHQNRIHFRSLFDGICSLYGK